MTSTTRRFIVIISKPKAIFSESAFRFIVKENENNKITIKIL